MKTTKKRGTKLVPPSKEQTDIDRIMINTVMMEEGIVPIFEPTHDVARALATLSPEDARKAKRRFRKLWRKALKKMLAEDNKSSYRATLAGKGKKVPSKAERLHRKRMVLDGLWKDCICSLVEKAKDPRK